MVFFQGYVGRFSSVMVSYILFHLAFSVCFMGDAVFLYFPFFSETKVPVNRI